jgi:hypothetical protein
MIFMASVRLRWWGFRVRLTHQEVTSLMGLVAATGTPTTVAVSGLLVAGGVAAGPAGVVAALLAIVIAAHAFWIASQDDGNGVVLHVFWNGTLFWVENPP